MRIFSPILYVFILITLTVGCKKSSDERITISHPLSDSAINTVVIEEIAQQPGVSKSSIMPEKVFWEQPNNADALDIVEITIAQWHVVKRRCRSSTPPSELLILGRV